MKEWIENSEFEEGSKSFGLPNDYFQKSAGSIFNKIEWQDEHKNFPRLLEVKQTVGFEIPTNYFIKNECALELVCYPTLIGLRNKNVFYVPENYFEGTEISMLATIVDFEEDFQTLNTLRKVNSFKVPENYFEQGTNTIAQELQSKSGKIVNLFARRLTYSIAAMLTIVLGVWMYAVYFDTLPEKDCGTIACLDKTDLVKTKTLERMDDEELYELVDPTLLEKRIQNAEATNSKNEIKDTSLKGISLEDFLDGI